MTNVLQNNYFEFNGETKWKISGLAIDIKFAPLYMYIDGPS